MAEEKESREKTLMVNDLYSELEVEKSTTYCDEKDYFLYKSGITAGSEFMQRFSQAFREYFIQRLNHAENWQHLAVIYSDASVPGEGEHKIFDFVRSQR